MNFSFIFDLFTKHFMFVRKHPDPNCSVHPLIPFVEEFEIGAFTNVTKYSITFSFIPLGKSPRIHNESMVIKFDDRFYVHVQTNSHQL